MAEKRYFWLKLKSDFFSRRQIKALRRLDNGADLIVVYLKMLLLCLNTDGLFHYEKLLPDCIEELSLAIDEGVSITSEAVETFIRYGLVERLDNEDLQVLAMSELIGSESGSAKRMRKHRASQCDKYVSQGDVEKEIDTETDIERRDRGRDTAAFSPPSLQEISTFILENNLNVNAEKFYNYYSSQGWLKSNGRPMTDWQASVRLWSDDSSSKKPNSSPSYDVKEYERRTLDKYRQFAEGGK